MLAQSMDKLIEQGRKEGIEKAKLEDARKMIEKGYSVRDIVDITGLSEDEVGRIEKE